MRRVLYCFTFIEYLLCAKYITRHFYIDFSLISLNSLTDVIS